MHIVVHPLSCFRQSEITVFIIFRSYFPALETCKKKAQELSQKTAGVCGAGQEFDHPATLCHSQSFLNYG